VLLVELLSTFQYTSEDQLFYLISFDRQAQRHGNPIVYLKLVVANVVVEPTAEGDDFLVVKLTSITSVLEFGLWNGCSLKDQT